MPPAPRKARPRIPPADFRRWLLDNNLTGSQAAPLFLTTPMMIRNWCARKGILPWTLQAAMVHLAASWSVRQRGPRRCGCGCQAFTYKSIYTGHYNLFLPDHSPAAIKTRARRATLGKPMPPPQPAHTHCPACRLPLVPGIWITSKKRKLVGTQCPKCSYRQLLREAS